MSGECIECGGPTTYAHDFHEITGFEERREGGGTNAVALRERTGRMMCRACMTLRRAGQSAQQGALDLDAKPEMP